MKGRSPIDATVYIQQTKVKERVNDLHAYKSIYTVDVAVKGVGV